MLLDLPTLQSVLGSRLRALPEGGLSAATRATFHSQRVTPEHIFVAMAGASGHGLDHADEALQRGAPFILSDRPHPKALLVDDARAALLELGRAARGQIRAPVVGVTGSAGKTTAKALLAAALDAHVSPGNLNTPVALACTLIDAAATPERPLVLELGVDAPGDMAQLTALTAPSDALLTLIAPAHLEALGDLAGVAREKGALLRAAPGHRFAAQSAYDQLPSDLQASTVAYRVVAPGHSDDRNEANVGQLQRTPHGAELRFTRHGVARRAPLPGWGRALAENAFGVLLLSEALGVELERAIERIARAELEPQRLAVRRFGELTLIDDSYNANPASAREALDLLAEFPAPHHAVLGSMLELGAESEAHHRRLGRWCAEANLTSLITVGAATRAIAESTTVDRHAESVAALLADNPPPPTSGTLLVKGSRGVALERLIDRWGLNPRERGAA